MEHGFCEDRQNPMEMSFNLSADEMRRIDAESLGSLWFGQMGLNRRHCERLFTILVELYNNALDHGLLCLDSNIKLLPDGFERYLTLRAERLAALTEGVIGIEIQRIEEEGAGCLQLRDSGCMPASGPPGTDCAGCLQLRMKDSGAGFDYIPYMNGDITKNTKPAGRGILLVKSLCLKMEYLGPGNEVIAQYRLEE